MPSPREKLAESLDVLKALQQGNRRVFRSEDLSRVHRERLLENGFLQEVMKGWLISSSPDAQAGESTPWHASFWEFCARYCDERFGQQWHLSPEQSLFLHGERTVIPDQLVVHSPKATNNDIKLLFGTTLYDLKVAEMPPPTAFMVRDGLRLFTPAGALVRVPMSFFQLYPLEAQVVMASLTDASDLLRLLLNGGHSAKAGYLAKAFRQTGRPEVADEILEAMKGAGYDVRESSPFEPGQIFRRPSRLAAPIVGRVEMLWQSMRRKVVASFPKAPGLPLDKEAYLRYVDEIYRTDAYHSLSIEGYSVTPALVERVRQGGWDPERDAGDRRNRDALAARGYWQAFRLVKKEVEKVIAGENPAALMRAAHNAWYRELFRPCVIAGLIDPGSLAGYRNIPVFLRGSRYVPPKWEAVRDAMPALFDLLEQEPEPSVRAVVGHWLFGYIHPYPDGNGRIARFLMNIMLASGGYPWTVIRVIDRKSYLSALDQASIEMDIHPFTTFIVRRVQWRLEPHDLRFPAPMESLAIGRDMILFYGQDGEACVRCAITGEALDDHFGERGKDRLEVFKANRHSIEQEVQRRYLAGDTEMDGSILIRAGDLPDIKQSRDDSQPAVPDGRSAEGVEGSAGGRSQTGTEDSVYLSVSAATAENPEQPGAPSQPAARDGEGVAGMQGSIEDRPRAGTKDAIDVSRPSGADAGQPGGGPSAAPDGGSPEGIQGSAEDRPRAGTEDSIDLSAAPGEGTEQSGAAPQPAAPDAESREGIQASVEDRPRAGTEDSIDLSAAPGEDTEQSGPASQPAAPDEGTPEGIQGRVEDRSRAGAADSIELSTAPGEDTEQSRAASQLAARDGGSPEGMQGGAVDRSRTGTVEPIDLSAAPGEGTEESGAASQPTAPDGGGVDGMQGSVEDRSRADTAGNYVQVHFELTQDSTGYPPATSEALWAVRVGPAQFRLDNIPYFVCGVSCFDVIEAQEETAGHFKYLRLVQPSGHSTLRVTLYDKGGDHRSVEERVNELRKQLQALGCSSEVSHIAGLISIDVPPDTVLADVRSVLEAGMTRGEWGYEEASLGESVH